MINIEQGKANIVVGGQWGSEGKGKLFGWLYNEFPEISVAVSDFTPNTGHTYIDDDGNKYVSKVIPIGMAFKSVRDIIIGPHAVFDIDRFKEELFMFRNAGGNHTNIHIHPLASIIRPQDIAQESRHLPHIASTMQGSSAAAVSKIARDPQRVYFARDCQYLKGMVKDTHQLMQNFLGVGRTALIETGQGFDLGLNHGYEWPYVTGRDCMLGRWLDNAGVHPRQLGKIVVALRTYPIRVGNVEGGTSGPCHDDQREIDWGLISKRMGKEIIEYTTVTKRVRRVFTWSFSQVDRMCRFIKPDFAFLNFVNYLRSGEEYQRFIKDVHHLLMSHNCELSIMGTGPKLSETADCVNVNEN